MEGIQDLPLWQLDLFPESSSEVHLLKFGGLGLLVLDSHGGRIWSKRAEDPYPYLGSDQWDLINASLAEGTPASVGVSGHIPHSMARAAFADVRVLLVVIPVPLVTVSPPVNDVLSGPHDDFKV